MPLRLEIRQMFMGGVIGHTGRGFPVIHSGTRVRERRHGPSLCGRGLSFLPVKCFSSLMEQPRPRSLPPSLGLILQTPPPPTKHVRSADVSINASVPLNKRFSDGQYGMVGGGSKASFTPFVDPSVYGTSPTDDDNISASGGFPLCLPPPAPLSLWGATDASTRCRLMMT